MMQKIIDQLPLILELAQEAGRAILEVYGRPVAEQGIEQKSDHSPLTLADRAANHIIVKGLTQYFPDLPIVSEEQSLPDYEVRKQWPAYWLVDPLDGTKEFIARTGEFTVNIALIEHGKPILGVICAPQQGVLYWGSPIGAFKQVEGGPSEAIRVQAPVPETLRVVCSRRHGLEMLQQRLPSLQAAELCSVGSSLKFCWLAEGKADLYPRFGATSEWDTAAGQCILEAAGGCVINLQGTSLQYNQQADIIQGSFLACANYKLSSLILSSCV